MRRTRRDRFDRGRRRALGLACVAGAALTLAWGAGRAGAGVSPPTDHRNDRWSAAPLPSPAAVLAEDADELIVPRARAKAWDALLPDRATTEPSGEAFGDFDARQLADAASRASSVQPTSGPGSPEPAELDEVVWSAPPPPAERQTIRLLPPPSAAHIGLIVLGALALPAVLRRVRAILR